ncbi:MAG: ATP-binding cassette domain-containing protein [Saprospiraceae bacterium]|jgi:cell division transport system ATP-binding protein|nr:ATP-binding cassette domain-containing protein [Saprospiraceae bacterium]
MVVNLQQCVIGNEGKEVMHDVNLQVMQGEFCYVTGRSGTGKSTLLKTLYGQYSLLSGYAELLGFDLSKISKEEIPDLRRKIGMVFQDFSLFPSWTVKRNLTFILEATDWKDKTKVLSRVDDVLASVGLTDMIDRKVFSLSGGEQQRLCIARAILNTPELIIADEPTGNLDSQSSDEVFQLFQQINQDFGTATIFATHDSRLINDYPARVIDCVDGVLVEM